MEAATANERDLERFRKIRERRKQEEVTNALRREGAGALDTVGTIARNAIMQPIAGYAGLIDALRNRDLASAVRRIEEVQSKAGGPSTAEGQRNLEAIGGALDTALHYPKMAVDALGEQSPIAGAAVLAAANAVDPTKLGRAAKVVKATKVTKAVEDSVPSLRETIDRAIETKKAEATKNISPKVEKITLDLRTPEGEAAFVQKYGRKPLHTMTEAERVENFGPAMAETPEVRLSDIKSKRELAIPGGLEADAPPMTLADQAKISAQAIDYNDLDPKLALDIHKRLVKSVDPGADPSQLELMNRLGFGITSGNAPITKNLLEWSQMRPRSEAEIEEWSRYSPVYVNEQLDSVDRNALNRAVNEAYGVQASERGGTGLANTANRQYVSDLAKMLRENEDFFRRKTGEMEPLYVERLMNQVRGLGPKTGSLGFAMIEPQTSNISAIDRHIADLTREEIKAHPATRLVYEQQMLNAYNNAQPKSRQAALYETARRRAGDAADEIEAEKFRDVVSTPQETKFRDAKTGDIRETIPAHLRELPFYEPDKAAMIGPMYATALRMIEEGGKPRGIGGFSNQWFDWDYQRSRAEPHAGLNPMATEMPRLTPEEYKLVRDTFSAAGAMNTKKDPSTGRLKPFKQTPDYRKMIYGYADPMLLGATGAGGAGALALIDALRDGGEE